MNAPLVVRRSTACRPITTSRQQRQVSICRALGSDSERYETSPPLVGPTTNRLFSCFFAASVAFASIEVLSNGDQAYALEPSLSTEEGSSWIERRKEMLREANDRALQLVSGMNELANTENNTSSNQETKSTLEMLQESVKEQQKKYDEQISKSSTLVPRGGSSGSSSSIELPKFSFPSFGGEKKDSEEAQTSEEGEKPELPKLPSMSPVVPKANQELVEPKSERTSSFSDFMKKYREKEEEKSKPVAPPPVVSKPKEEPVKQPQSEETLSFSDFMKKYGGLDDQPKPVTPPPVISAPKEESVESKSFINPFKKKYESKEELPKPTPVQPAAPVKIKQEVSKKVEQKTTQKPKRKGVLPLWAAQFFMLGLFGGFIYCFTVLYESTSKIIKSTFITIDQFLEDLKFSYGAIDSTKDNKS
eukprot:g1086.t1